MHSIRWVGLGLVALWGCTPPPLPDGLRLVVDGPVTVAPGEESAPVRVRAVCPGCNIDWTPYEYVLQGPADGTPAQTGRFDPNFAAWESFLIVRGNPESPLRGEQPRHTVVLRRKGARVKGDRPIEAPVIITLTGGSFSLVPSPAALQLTGGLGLITVEVQREAGFTEPVQVNFEAAEATVDDGVEGGAITVEPLDGAPTDRARFLVRSLNAGLEEYHARFSAVAGNTRRVVSVVIDRANASPTPDALAVTTTPTSTALRPGTSMTVAVTAQRLHGFAGAIEFAAASLPSGVTATFAPPTALAGRGPASSTMTLTASAQARPGIDRCSVVATSGARVAAYDFQLTIPGPPRDAGPEEVFDAGEELDAGTTDAGTTDAGTTDAGTTDAGSTDAGSTDAGSTDAGSTDAGSTDAGSTDAGSTDAGSTDAGLGIILTFTASPLTGDAGIPVTFAWTTNNADRCALAPSSFSILNPNDSLTFNVAATTTFTLTCYRQLEQESRSLTVTLTPPPVSITSFTVAPSPLSLGDEAWLSWTVENATSCSIMPGAHDAGPPTGSFSLVPLGDTTFTLTCDGRGGPVSASASVLVIPNNPPEATIIAPDAGAVFELGDPVTLSGTCTDDLAGGLDLWPSWSTVPGQLSLGSDLVTVTRSLGPGPHTVQLQCFDALGKVDPSPPQTSFTVAVPRVATASVALTHQCLRTESGKLFCAGDNRQGLLGQGTTSPTPVLRPVMVGSRADWLQVVTANTATFARAADGTMWWWSQGAPTPAQVGTGNGWTHLSTSASHRCALRGGELWCWGANFKSQLGVSNGSFTDPTRVGTDSDWTWVSTSSDGTCGLRGTTAWCWGRPLGTAFTASGSLSQVQTGASITWATMSLGVNFACGLDSAGALYCWGEDSSGQLGDGTAGASSLSPVRVGTASDWVEISAGAVHACGRRSNGSLWCWGSDVVGQLGNGDAGTTATPTQVGTALDWVQVNAGGASGYGTCGVRDGGQAFCWGAGEWGQLAIGRLQPAVQDPTPVSFAP